MAFGAWLKRIVINKSLTQLKKNKRYDEVKLEVISNEEQEEEIINYSGIKAEEIAEKINSLKQNYSLVLNLHLIEGFDYDEIAQILNYTNENVRTTVSRAKKKLKKILQEDSLKTQLYGR